MSKADVLFVNMCEKILEEGFSSEGMQVLPYQDTPGFCNHNKAD